MAKVLLIAPGVDGTDVGEAWVGYQWAKRLGARHTLTLLTHRKHGRPSAVPQLPGVEVVEFEEPAWMARPERFSSLVKPWYPRFYASCLSWVRAAQREGRHFDVAHQPTPVAMRYPSPLARTGIPYVLGPTGGSLETPAGFVGEETAPWYVGLRRLDSVRLRADPVLRRSYRRAGLVLGIAPYVADLLAPAGIARFETMNDTGVDALPPPVERAKDPEVVRLLFVGRVIRTKGVRDAVRAMGQLTDLPLCLDIVGTGFDEAECRRLAEELGVADRVHFHGQVPRDHVAGFYRRADLFVFPSYREPGGTAPYEALSFGLPVIAADRGGPAVAVTAESGVLVTPRDPQQYAAELAAAIRTLAVDGEHRLALGRGARERAAAVAVWEPRITRMEGLYAEVMGVPSLP